MSSAWDDDNHTDEGHGRGVGYLLLMIPLGVAVWLFVWQIGIVTSLVPVGIALGAVYLYRYGSGGSMSGRGLFSVSAVVILTVALGLAGSFVFDAYRNYPLSQSSGGVFEQLGVAFGDADFWHWFWLAFVSSSTTWEAWIPNILIALFFAALGAVPALTLAYLGARNRVTSSAAFTTISIVAAIAGLLTFVLGPVSIDLPESEAEIAAAADPRVVGDCLEAPGQDLGNGDLAAVPLPVNCSEQHWAEVLHVGEVGPTVDVYPGDSELGDLAFEQCTDPYLEYVGTPMDQTTLEIHTIFPSEESWADGDRSLLCLVRDPVGTNVGSLAGSAL